MKVTISTYWKCQLLGWSSYVIIAYGFNNILYKDFVGFFYKAIMMFFFGLVFSHLIKLTIKKTRILQRKFILQIIYLSILTILFSLVGTYIYMVTLIKTGVWDIESAKKSQPGFFLYQLYFYNLFPILLTIAGWVLIYFLVHYVNKIRIDEQLKMQYKVQMNELEAKALRAQMNPHFIFNSLNSIKSLINKNKNENAAEYLTVFSKLIRVLFQNSDKRDISLYEELESCKLYTQIEQMRFGNKVEFIFNVDERIDLKDFKVPALILQPFIENAIWHGLIPKETGGKVTISVAKNSGAIQCIIDDNGIGREQSKQFKPQYEATYQSKGIGLTQSRLELDKLLNDREDAIFIIDKEDEKGRSEGTRVIISFKENIN